MNLMCEKISLNVFYKERPPSLKVLAKVDSLLSNYHDKYEIKHYNIESSESAQLISKSGLPETHFPFAVTIDGKFSAEIDKEKVYFVHFPLFMKGIGRHEGNWSLHALKKILENNELLIDKNTLPALDESSETSECEGE